MASSRSAVTVADVLLLLGLLLLAGASAAAAEGEGGARAASSAAAGSDDRSDAEVLDCAVWCAELGRVCITSQCDDAGKLAAEVGNCAIGCIIRFLPCQSQCVAVSAPPPANE